MIIIIFINYYMNYTHKYLIFKHLYKKIPSGMLPEGIL
jgi:hypothetical protein